MCVVVFVSCVRCVVARAASRVRCVVACIFVNLSCCRWSDVEPDKAESGVGLLLMMEFTAKAKLKVCKFFASLSFLFLFF